MIDIGGVNNSRSYLNIMLDGWYCRSIASEAAAAEEEERAQEESKLKIEYKFLKGKLKNLLYVSKCTTI